MLTVVLFFLWRLRRALIDRRNVVVAKRLAIRFNNQISTTIQSSHL